MKRSAPRRRLRSVGFLVGLGFVLGGCRLSAPAATQADAQRANVLLADLAQGRAMMVRKCGNCHQPPMPSDHPASLWPAKLDEMGARAHLDARQRFLIQQYLVVMAQR